MALNLDLPPLPPVGRTFVRRHTSRTGGQEARSETTVTRALPDGYEFEVVRTGAGATQLRTVGGRNPFLTRQTVSDTMVRQGTVTAGNPEAIFPIAIGKSVQYDLQIHYEVKGADGRVQRTAEDRVHVTLEVVGTETLQLPIGSVETFRLRQSQVGTRTEKAQVDGKPQEKKTPHNEMVEAYYSPVHGVTVKVISPTETTEMVSFR